MGLPRDDEESEELVEFPFSHAQATAGFAAKLWRCAAGRTFRLDEVLYYNAAGLVEDATNAFALDVRRNGAADALSFTAFTFTTTHAAETLTKAAHGLQTGDGPVQLTTDDTLPTGWAEDTDYYAIRVDANTLKLAATRSAAIAGTAVAIDDDGTGTHTLTATASCTRPTVAADGINTDSGGAGTNTLAADTLISLTLSADDADRIFAGGDELLLVAAEKGAATLPAGSGLIRGRYVG
jgi:hypothetical protein